MSGRARCCKTSAIDQVLPSLAPRDVDTIDVGSLARPSPTSMVDGFGRRIDYVRISITDRCDLRCRYCMAEEMRFEPKRNLLTLGEIETLADMLIARGTRRIRLSGGEPLVRPGAIGLIHSLGKRVGDGSLEELTLTTNGTRLDQFAQAIADAGVRRINVSLDSRDADRFRHITRFGDLDRVLRGITAATSAGLKIRINMVALAGVNEDEIGDMLSWCVDRGFDLALIETMPLGDVGEDRTDQYLPLDSVREELARKFRLTPSTHRTSGPARYYCVGNSASRLGLITPISRNFCDDCNRIRISATGSVYGCLGHDQKVELRELLRSGGTRAANAALDDLLAGKPRRHQFDLARPATPRHMSVTGG